MRGVRGSVHMSDLRIENKKEFNRAWVQLGLRVEEEYVNVPANLPHIPSYVAGSDFQSC